MPKSLFNCFQEAPASSLRYKPLSLSCSDSMTVYKILGLDGAMAMPNRPSLPLGKPLWILFQVFPPSVDLYKALLAPPELKFQAVRRNSQNEAYNTWGLVGSMAISAQPVLGST